MIIDIGDKVKFKLCDLHSDKYFIKYGYVQSCSNGMLDVIDEDTHVHYGVFIEDAELVPGENFFKKTAEKIADDKKRSAHYSKMKIQPLDVIKDWPVQQQIGALRFAALKYLMRLGNKDEGLTEAEKSHDFTGWLVKILKGEDITNR